VAEAVAESLASIRVSDLFRVLADLTARSVLLAVLRDGEVHQGAITRQIGLSRPAISYQLGRLLRAGLLEVREEGKYRFYRVAARVTRGDGLVIPNGPFTIRYHPE
jgi:DNA-binding transcriptional ArsR family regulator